MKQFIYIIAVMGLISAFSACTKDLDTIPIDPDADTSENVFQDPEAYTQFLAKCYAGLAIGGNEGGDGSGDIAGIDGGFSNYLRLYFDHQELTTDEAVIGWNDATIKDFHYQQWGIDDTFIAAMFSRLYYQISLCNEYLRQTTDEKLDDRGTSDAVRADIVEYRLEIRFLRALSYTHVVDMFGNGIFVTEDDPIGDPDFLPPYATREQLFAYAESELLAIESLMKAPRTNEYGRVDQAAAWTVLAKLYLNAEVYIGQSKYADALTYADKVIASSYTLAPTWEQLFWANNDQIEETMAEIIFPIRYDGLRTETWGGTTFLLSASIGGSMNPADYGTSESWGGLRVTPEFVDVYGDYVTNGDRRAIFYTDGQSESIADVGTFEDGYAFPKFVNYSMVDDAKVDGANSQFPDTDFPMFRLADLYLIYAEAVVRGGGGDLQTATDYVNALRSRADAPVILSSDLTLDFILDERARELAWECHRRTDLIRFGKFTTGDYIWEWKGNTQSGRATEAKYKLFPIPANDITTNSNLVQNPGY